MANYIASARSNYFQVKDIEAFKEGLAADITVNVKDKDNNIVCMYVENFDGTGWPVAIYDEEKEEDVMWDIAQYVSQHLTDNQWCVIQEIGAENLRYLVGYSKAFNNKGDCVIVDINDVYAELPDNEVATLCEY